MKLMGSAQGGIQEVLMLWKFYSEQVKIQDWYTHVHGSLIQNSYNMEAAQVPINEATNTQNVTYIRDG